MLRLFSVLCRVSGFGRRCRAWCPRWLSWFCVPVVVPAFGVLLCVLCRVVGSVFFVRRPCPSCPWGFWSSRCWWRWCCLPSSSVAAFRASVPVLVVAPAVVVRFGRCRGVVLSSWVFFCSLGFPEGTTTTNCEPPTIKPPYGGESGGNAAAVAAVSSNLYQEVNIMRNYKEAYISELIAKRAKEKAERRGGTFANEGATRGIVPFTEWLYYTEGIVRWTELSKYQLWNYYLDYRVECVRNGMMFQCGEIYGLTNV